MNGHHDKILLIISVQLHATLGLRPVVVVKFTTLGQDPGHQSRWSVDVRDHLPGTSLSQLDVYGFQRLHKLVTFNSASGNSRQRYIRRFGGTARAGSSELLGLDWDFCLNWNVVAGSVFRISTQFLDTTNDDKPPFPRLTAR